MLIAFKSREAALHCAEPSPLLRHLACDFAPRIAAAWPQPHAPFLGAPADRRHVVCLAIALGGDELDAAALRRLFDVSLKQAVKSVCPVAPAGLARALGHIGEIAWAESDYRRLLAVLSQPQLSAPIRHAKQIELGIVRALWELPEPLREAGLAKRALTIEQINLLGELFTAVARRDGPTVARDSARRWAAATSLKDVFTRARDDVCGEFPEPPFPGTSFLRAIRTKAELVEAAARYRNCARDYMMTTSQGTAAFYEWTVAPTALVQLSRDGLYGWALEQSRLADNAIVPEAVRHEIVRHLRGWGVHVGRLSWGMNNELRAAHQPNFRVDALDEVIGELFGA
jgi:hypothetical protein